jgi:hypothetical protein
MVSAPAVAWTAICTHGRAMRPGRVAHPLRVTLLLAVVAAPSSVVGQPAVAPRPPDDTPPTWAMTGVDVVPTDRVHATLRVGYLGDIDSRLLLADVAVVARPAVHVLVGQVVVDSRAAGTHLTSLTRAGALWLPLRRRLAVDVRLLAERQANQSVGIATRGRSRLRMSWATARRPAPTLFGTFEAIANTDVGLVERRTQLGLVESVGRWSAEVYWLQRRVRRRHPFNGIGATLAYRVGT